MISPPDQTNPQCSTTEVRDSSGGLRIYSSPPLGGGGLLSLSLSLSLYRSCYKIRHLFFIFAMHSARMERSFAVHVMFSVRVRSRLMTCHDRGDLLTSLPLVSFPCSCLLLRSPVLPCSPRPTGALFFLILPCLPPSANSSHQVSLSLISFLSLSDLPSPYTHARPPPPPLSLSLSLSLSLCVYLYLSTHS